MTKKPKKLRQYDLHVQKGEGRSLQGNLQVLWALVFIPNRLLGMLSSIEVELVQILNTWHQIFQGVASHLCKGLGLRRSQQSHH